jgi:hypothetical protein
MKRPAFVDLLGQRFGRLTVESRAASVRTGHGTKVRWNCIRDCGGRVTITTGSLRSGNTKSCGCYQLDRLRAKTLKHGHARKGRLHPLYSAWGAMLSRCSDPKVEEFRNYGARGITVCSRWRKGDGIVGGFECFLADMGNRPSPQHSLDRIDNERGYDPDNCRWATRRQQNLNRRLTKKLRVCGADLIFIDACQIAGLSPKVVDARVRARWRIDRAFNFYPFEWPNAFLSLGC